MQNENNLPSNMMDNATLYMPTTESLGKLKNAETGRSLTVSYKSQEDWQDIKDKPVRCYFLGLKQMPNEKGEVVLCAGFMSADEVFIAAQLVLIDAIRHLAIGTAVEITFMGKKKNKSSAGSTNLFVVNLLNIIN